MLSLVSRSASEKYNRDTLLIALLSAYFVSSYVEHHAKYLMTFDRLAEMSYEAAKKQQLKTYLSRDHGAMCLVDICAFKYFYLLTYLLT